MCDNCQYHFGYSVVGTNHLIFRIKSYNQCYKIILVPSVLVIHLPDVILINFLSTLCLKLVLFLNIAYHNISQIHDILFNVLMTLFKLFIVYSYAFI